MSHLNTLPIETFLNKARIAVKSGQKHLTLDIKEVQSLQDSLSIVMTRLVGELDAKLQESDNSPDVITINMDGGNF